MKRLFELSSAISISVIVSQFKSYETLGDAFKFNRLRVSYLSLTMAALYRSFRPIFRC